MFDSGRNIVSPPLPLWFSLPAIILFGIAVAYWIMRTRGRAARFLIFACWIRYSLGALQQFVYQEALPDVKWVALASLGLIALGFVILDKRRIFSAPFVPVGLICLLMIISAIANQAIVEAIDPLLRFVFFVLIAVALWQALETGGSVVLRRLLFVFIQPIVFQAASIALGVAKFGEMDGSISYIGGYYHEDLFSLILATGFLVAILAPRLETATRFLFAGATFAGIFIANYRTTILGVVPLGVAGILAGIPQAFQPGQRALVRGGLAAMGGLLIIVGAATMQDRFSELAVAVEHPTALMKPPENYSPQDRSFLSSRPYLWSLHIYGFLDGSTTQKVIGHGPDSWIPRFPTYAHNEIVSFLFELGVAGVAALLFLWATMLRYAFQADQRWRTLLISAHAGFIILCQAGMPLWQIEGNIFYGLLCGFTIAKARVAVRASSAVETEPPSTERLFV